jgi:hypothetical protein
LAEEGQQLDRLLAIGRAAAACSRIMARRKHALAVAGIGRALVPIGGLGVIALDAEPFGVEFSSIVIRLGIAVILRGAWCARSNAVL